MLKHVIHTPNAPQPIGPYSQAIAYNGLVYISGQIPMHPDTGVIPDAIAEQTHQALDNLVAIIHAADATVADVIKNTIYIKDMNDFETINRIYSTYFSEPYPARAVVEVARLPKDVGIEIESIVSHAHS